MDRLPRWADVALVPLVSLFLAFMIAALVILAIGPSPALAADEPAAPIERGYTISYLLVAVLAGLGVAATCKSAYRHAKEETI